MLQVIDQYQMTSDMWEERITSWYAEHKGMRRCNCFSFSAIRAENGHAVNLVSCVSYAWVLIVPVALATLGVDVSAMQLVINYFDLGPKRQIGA